MRNFKIFLALLFVVYCMNAASAKSKGALRLENTYNGCSGGDCIIYDLSTQNTCTLKSSSRTSNMQWVYGLSRNVDFKVYGGRIITYRLRWSSGAWSGWYVPGINDIDVKKNSNNTLRRMWAYFYDHSFEYIICI